MRARALTLASALTTMFVVGTFCLQIWSYCITHPETPGLGFSSVVIDLLFEFQTCPNYNYKKLPEIVVDCSLTTIHYDRDCKCNYDLYESHPCQKVEMTFFIKGFNHHNVKIWRIVEKTFPLPLICSLFDKLIPGMRCHHPSGCHATNAIT